uniref:Uncharacterized protein n=1 Tax=Glossina austeni TaxID=7395 RepID=A0A1A9VAI3_GLOAU
MAMHYAAFKDLRNIQRASIYVCMAHIINNYVMYILFNHITGCYKRNSIVNITDACILKRVVNALASRRQMVPIAMCIMLYATCDLQYYAYCGWTSKISIICNCVLLVDVQKSSEESEFAILHVKKD